MNKVILITSLLVIFSLSLLLINKDNTFQMSAKEETAKEETLEETRELTANYSYDL